MSPCRTWLLQLHFAHVLQLWPRGMYKTATFLKVTLCILLICQAAVSVCIQDVATQDGTASRKEARCSRTLPRPHPPQLCTNIHVNTLLSLSTSLISAITAEKSAQSRWSTEVCGATAPPAEWLCNYTYTKGDFQIWKYCYSKEHVWGTAKEIFCVYLKHCSHYLRLNYAPLPHPAINNQPNFIRRLSAEKQKWEWRLSS